MAGFDIRSRIKHLLHTRSTFRPFVSDDDDVSTDYLSTQNTVTSRILWVEDFRRPRKFPDTLVYTGSLDNATVLSYISLQNCQTAILAVCMFQITDTTGRTVRVEFLIRRILWTKYQIELSGCRTGVFLDCLFTYIRAGNTIPVDCLCQRHSIHTADIRIDQSALGKLIHDGNDATGTVNVLYMILLGIGSHLA